ncbi:MAG: MBOAT family protein [Gammaproteobacteria bacterium]|nr:MBOAT family protein [Gammaproteobacteria bacterium]
MVFSSPVFLFLFLPAILAGYFLLPTLAARNLLLLAGSLFFYAWGEVHYVLILLASIAVNTYIGVRISRSEGATRGWNLAAGLAVNLGLLGYFKYANFVVDNLNALLGWSGTASVDYGAVHLPLGISFFTFQAISYIVDVYRRDAAVQENFLDVALYISLFPQLIAGPIVRYGFIARQLTERTAGLDDVAAGARRFTIGLAKKVLIANTAGEAADEIFAHDPDQLDPALAWLGVLCYGIQIYFDFSGYSDMAIGLGRMFGFRFPENFRTPYAARSLREFWRRWHISLSTWFRDYVYIPLGGSRVRPVRVRLNLLLVFFLTGLWHGASWNFVVWGFFHGGFLALERTRWGTILERLPRVLQHLYLLLVVGVAWVFFRAADLDHALGYLSAMFGTAGREQDWYFAALLTPKLVAALVAGIAFSFPWWEHHRLAAPGAAGPGRALIGNVAWLVLFTTCLLVVAGQSHDPFIYFRF